MIRLEGCTFQSCNLTLNGSGRHDWMVNSSGVSVPCLCLSSSTCCQITKFSLSLCLFLQSFGLGSCGRPLVLFLLFLTLIWSHTHSLSPCAGICPCAAHPTSKLIPELRASCLSQSQRSYSWRPGQSLHCCTHILVIKAMSKKLSGQKWIFTILIQLKVSNL